MAYGKVYSVRLTPGLKEDIRCKNRHGDHHSYREESPFDGDCICLKFDTAFLQTIDKFIISITQMPVLINLEYLLVESGFNATYYKS